MEVKEKSKKRELIKTIAIIFLAVLLVLTFFSQTIMNYSLPEVATQLVSSGTINAKIRGSGTVSANESYEVVLNQTREIRSVCVKAGDTVQEGDLLFVLDDMESQELQDAVQQLRQLELDYQTKLLNFSKSYASEDLSVKNIQEDLQKAMAERDANLVTDAEISYAKGDLAQAKTELGQIEIMLSGLNQLQSTNEEYTAAKSKVDEINEKIKTLNNTVTEYQEELKKLGTGESVDTERAILDAQSALETSRTKWAGDWGAYASVIDDLMGGGYAGGGSPRAFTSSEQVAIEGRLGYLEINPGPTQTVINEEGEETTMPTMIGRYTLEQCRAGYNALLADQTDVAEKEEAYLRAIQDQSTASDTLADQQRTLEDKIEETRMEISAAQRQLQDAQAQLDAASGSDAQTKEQIRVYESAKREQEAEITELEAALADLEAKQSLYKAAVETVAAKERELETAMNGTGFDKQLNNLELQTQRLQIEQQQEKVGKLRTDTATTEVTAKVSGIVKSVNVTAGKENTPGEAMAVIDVVDRGYTIKISVTSDQAKEVKVGDTADVTNYYWGSDVTATLEQITPDPDNPGQKKLLVFRLTGDIDAGANISLSIGQRSAPFDTIVPKSALREDTNGHFVLIITSRNTPLGNRYTATRVDVQVLAEDDTSAAVSGLAANDYVITTSSKPLAAGTQVRMVENA